MQLALNESVMRALGLDHLGGVVALDVTIRPGELPVAKVEKYIGNFDLDNTEVLTWTLTHSEPRALEPFDLEAMCQVARDRVADGIEQDAEEALEALSVGVEQSRQRLATARYLRDYVAALTRAIRDDTLPVAGGFLHV